MAIQRKASGNAVTSAPSPSAAAPNQTSVAMFMPATASSTARRPRSIPVAMENRFAGPGVTASTAMTPQKAM